MLDVEVWREASLVGVWEERISAETTLEDLLMSRKVLSPVCPGDDRAPKAAALSAVSCLEGTQSFARGVDAVVVPHTAASNGASISLRGLRVDRGYSSPLFVTELTSMTTSLTDAYVFVQHGRFTSLECLLPLVEKVAGSGRPLLIIADVEGDAMSMLLVNKLRCVIEVCVIKPPSFGEERSELLEDIAVAVGSHSLSPAFGRSIASLTLEELGSAEHIIVSQEHTVVIGGKGSKRDIRARVAHLRERLSLESSSERAPALRLRLDKLGGNGAMMEQMQHGVIDSAPLGAGGVASRIDCA